MKIVSWNVNGIRSIFKSTFLEYLERENPDIICLQETKATHEELSREYKEINGYYAYFNSSQTRKGYSGVAVYTKIKPSIVETRIGIDRFDDEGRLLKLVFDDFVLFNVYIPNGGRDKRDMAYKLSVYDSFIPLLAKLADNPVIVAGDFNIAHSELDVYHAKHNYRNTMFTPEERDRVTTLCASGYTDAFRYRYPEKQSYTWWPYMGDLRERNVGWRIDYFFITRQFQSFVVDVFSQREVLGSDHGPLCMLLDKQLSKSETPMYSQEIEQLPLF